MDAICLPDEVVAGLSVLFTVLYICKRSSKEKRMTKKAKLRAHFLLA
jgi:hypothetical protein